MAKSTLRSDDPKALLSYAVILISRDLKDIEKNSHEKSMTFAMASKLDKHAMTLLSISKYYDDQKDEFKRELDSKTVEELIKLGEESIQQLKGQQTT